MVEEQGDWDRIWLGRPGLLEAVEELLESGKGADVEVRTWDVPCGSTVDISPCVTVQAAR